MRGFRESLFGRKTAVLGGGRSGLAAVRLLRRLGAAVFLSDQGTLPLSALTTLRALGVAFEMGAHSDRALQSDLVVLSPGVPERSRIFQAVRKARLPHYGELELGWRFTKGKYIAVTGTNGKSTTTALVAHILRDSGAIPCGNIGLPLSRLAGKEGLFVLEVSSFQLATILDFRPQVAAVLNLAEDHLDWHFSFESYREAKFRITENQGVTDALVLNADDPELLPLAKRTRARVYWFSLEREADAFLRDGTLYLRRGSVQVPLLGQEDLKIQGVHNLANALAAALIAMLAGASSLQIALGLASFPGLPHRLQFVREVGGVRFYNDSKATNPHAVAYSLRSFEAPLVVIMGGLAKGLDFRPLVPLVQERVRGLVLIGQDRERIRAALGGVVDRVEEANSLEEAVRRAFHMARPGWVVLLAPGCASFDMFRDYKERGERFVEAVEKL